MTFFLSCGLAGLFSGNIMRQHLLTLTVQPSVVAGLSLSFGVLLPHYQREEFKW